jgi:hypothetical protein
MSWFLIGVILTVLFLGLAFGYLAGFTRGFALGQLDERERTRIQGNFKR